MAALRGRRVVFVPAGEVFGGGEWGVIADDAFVDSVLADPHAEKDHAALLDARRLVVSELDGARVEATRPLVPTLEGGRT
jgi:hypothetical protein